MDEKIMRNRAKCKLCKQVIESVHRHDYVSCKCGEIAVDGGKDYLRRTAKHLSNIEEMSIVKKVRRRSGYPRD